MSTKTIYNLTYELSHQNGKSIIFTEHDKTKLTNDDLHAVQLKMIQSTQIPHVLALSVENIDLKTKLHYDITNKNKIVAFFRNNSTSMSDYYHVLLSIIKTLETSSSYMLDQDNFLLNTDFIFIGENLNDVYLTYLPVTHLEKGSLLIDELKVILTDIASEVGGLQGNEFKSILNYIKDPSFSISGLKKLVLELISLRSNINQVNINHHSNYDTPHMNTNHSTPESMNFQKSNNTHSAYSEEKTDEISLPKTKKKSKKRLPALTSREGTYLIVAALLFIGISWKLYDINTSQAMLMVSSSLTVMILICVIVYWKIWRPGVKPIVTEQIVEENKVPSKQPQQPVYQQSYTPSQNNNSNLGQFEQAPPNQNKKFFEQHTHTFGAQQSAATSMDTVLLDQFSDDTVLLEDEDNLDFGQAAKQEEILPMLVKQDEAGQEEQIMITQSNFLIGRNAESVNHAEDTVGVSRIHAEIVKIDHENYALKDLGSKNGSKLNGKSMVPYKIHALSEGDEIELGKATYTFKWSQSK